MTSTDGNGNTTTVQYVVNPATTFPTDIRGTDPLGNVVTITTDPARGSTTDTVDARGNHTRMQYDQLGRLIAGFSPSEHGDIATVKYAYAFDVTTSPNDNSPGDYRHGLTKVATWTLLQAAGDSGNTTGTSVYTSSFAYVDGLGRTVETQIASPTGGRVITDSIFDDRGLSSRAIDPYTATDDPGSGPIYPAIPAASHEIDTSFDGAARPISTNELVDGNIVATTRIDYNGRTTTTAPAVGDKTITVTDAFGRVVSSSHPNGATTLTTFDVRDLPLSVSAAGVQTINKYDLAGRQLSKVDPDAGSSSAIFDPNGNVTSTTDAKGQVVATTYDALNRPLQRTAAGVVTATWDYYTSGPYQGLAHTTSAFDASHQLTSTTTIDAYDDHSSPTSSRVTVPGGIASTTTQTYDRAGNVRTNGRSAVGPALAEQLTNGYNSLGQATSLNEVAGGVTSNYVADTSLLEGCAIDHGGGGESRWVGDDAPAIGRPQTTDDRRQTTDHRTVRRLATRVASISEFDAGATEQRWVAWPGVTREPVALLAMSDRTLVLLKPDAVQRKLTGEIIRRFESKDLVIVAMDLRVLDEATLAKHYADHVGKPFYAGLVEFMSSGPIVAMVIEGPEDTWEVVRGMMGATNSRKAAPGTIRGDLSASFTENLVHGSDSLESATREIGIFFPNL